MNISIEIPLTDESNSSDYYFSKPSAWSITLNSISFVINGLLGLPTNSYVIWLIVTGTGNGLAAEYFSLSLSVCEILYSMCSFLPLLVYEFPSLLIAVYFLIGLPTIGRPLFQCLICVERFLAVVHPITFLKFKPLRYRVFCSVIAWVATFGFLGVNGLTLLLSNFKFYLSLLFAQLFLFLSIQLFCCLAVLRALKHSGPGERGKERVEENHMKRKAFNIILISTVTMVIIYGPIVISVLLSFNSTQNTELSFNISDIFFTLAGLVQPFLFLDRVGKLPFIKC